MTSGLFDTITRAFLAAIEAGTLSLGAYSLPILGTFALIGWYWQFGRALAAGGGQLGDGLAAALLYAVNIGVAYWLLVNLHPMAMAAYQTFLQWGMAAGGGGEVAGMLLTPSTVAPLGFEMAAPLTAAATDMVFSWPSLWTLPSMMLLYFAVMVLVLAFPLVAIALMMAQIEYSLAVMVGAVLIPFGIFGPTAFLTEFCIGWITGGLLRILVTAVMVGVGFPLFAGELLTLTTAGNPDVFSSLVVAILAALYAGLAWSVPNKAATMCGRVALGLSGSTVVSAAMTAARFGMAAGTAVRGVSQMMQRRPA